MQHIERRKSYKATDPLTTINHIRSLLTSYDIFTIEGHVSHTGPRVSCCRVELGDNDIVQLGVGSNGKGLTARYALASAYGEFMERLQNNILCPTLQPKFATKRYLATVPATDNLRKRLEREDLLLNFHYAPDEIYIDINSLVENCSDVLTAMLRIEGKDKQKDYLHKAFGEEAIACLPYYSVLQNQVRLLPINLILNTSGTNGMSAGNTPEEAIIQGISEIFERFVIRSIYQHNITPPTIPSEYFQNTTILSHIQSLEKEGITAVIKDCSLGLGLPVIGLLLFNQTNEKYTFHLGADPCPITALERSLTEIFQGSKEDVEAKFHFRKVRNTPVEKYNNDDGFSDFSMRTSYCDTITGGQGQWPESIFSDNATYPFEGFFHPVSVSDISDLGYLVTIVKNLGGDLFIRDVSFLGFPSYQILIPGMTETDFIFEKTDFPDWMDVVSNQLTLLNLRQADTESITRLANAIHTIGLTQPKAFEMQHWFLSNVHPELQNLSKDYLLTLLYTRISNYQAAAESMALFLKSEAAQSGPMLYYQTLQSYLQAKSDRLQDDKIKAMLTDSYGEAMVKRVLEAFAVPEMVFEQATWPSCFDCDSCGIENYCRYFTLLRRVKTIQKIQQTHLPKQAELAKVFDNVRMTEEKVSVT